MKKKPLVLISFSGGETSGFMAQWLLKHKSDEYEFIVIFANTGRENEETLAFVHWCDQYFGLNVIWVEGVTNPVQRKGMSAKVVTYETADRSGAPMRGLIEKHGIPNKPNPICSRDLKARTIRAYMRSLGYKKSSYVTAIGIRADEIDRVSEQRIAEGLIYPLVTMQPMTKPMINFFWNNMPRRLQLKGWEGNCQVCYKKSLRKLLTIARKFPERFDFEVQIEKEFGHYVPEKRLKTLMDKGKEVNFPITYFRGNLSALDILKMAQEEDFEEASDDSVVYDESALVGYDLDKTDGCSESCEVF